MTVAIWAVTRPILARPIKSGWKGEACSTQPPRLCANATMRGHLALRTANSRRQLLPGSRRSQRVRSSSITGDVRRQLTHALSSRRRSFALQMDPIFPSGYGKRPKVGTGLKVGVKEQSRCSCRAACLSQSVACRLPNLSRKLDLTSKRSFSSAGNANSDLSDELLSFALAVGAFVIVYRLLTVIVKKKQPPSRRQVNEPLLEQPLPGSHTASC